MNIKIIFYIILFGFLTYLICKQKIISDKPPFPIDIVYTWAGENNDKNNMRLAYNNELKYSIRSVFKYAPWFNKIYILMNPPKKVPSWFNDKYSDKIILVDHNQTFEKRHLPSTNSNAIETTLVNIPNLSEHFIYFNDDVYLGRPTSYLDFFNRDGSKIIVDKRKVGLEKHKCKNLQLEGKEKILNFNLPIHCNLSNHTPFANKKSIIIKYQKKYKEYIEWVRNIKERKGTGNKYCENNNLRNWCQQQHTPIFKFAYDNNLAIIKDFDKKDIVYIEYNYRQKLYNLIKNPPLFFCINDTNIKGKDRLLKRELYQKEANKILEKMFNLKTYFEN